MRAEHRLDALLCAFGAAAASIVRVVGQYPCPLQPTHSQELTERYGPGLKYVANGIVVRRVTTGLAIAQSAEVCAAVTSAPKVAAAHQRACNAARGRIDSLCVPLSTVVEFLGVRWEATAVVPCGELGYGTYTGGRSEPLRQLEQAAPVVAALAEAFGHADAEGGGADGVEEAVAEGPLPRSTRLFLVDDMPGPIPALAALSQHPFCLSHVLYHWLRRGDGGGGGVAVALLPAGGAGAAAAHPQAQAPPAPRIRHAGRRGAGGGGE